MTSKKTPEGDRISLAHGNGGRLMRELIEEVFAAAFDGTLQTECDAALLPLGEISGEWMITTDGFTVEPLEFPGGDIGSLAVHGTINDLAVSGAEPRFITLNAFIEEGLELATLQRIVRSIARACGESGVRLLAGDTKVVRRGQGGGLYLATTGVGRRTSSQVLGIDQVRTGDSIVVSGTLGDHGTAVMLAREQFGLRGELRSDAASVVPVASILMEVPGLRFMRDPTRGGLATVAHEIAASGLHTIRLFEDQLPLRPEVVSVCEILGYDPLYLASEGRVVAVMPAEVADRAVAALHARGYRDARRLGRIEAGPPRVVLQTRLGGERVLPELEDDPLPRIC